jgi:hypothetical protein
MKDGISELAEYLESDPGGYIYIAATLQDTKEHDG